MSLPTTHTAVLLLSLLSVVTAGAGVLLALLIRDNTRAIAAGIGFSTGIMIVVSALELIPEAHAAIGWSRTGLAVALGIAPLWLASFLIPHTHLVEERGALGKEGVKSVYLVVFGLILHDVPEGFAMANAYIASPSLGLLVALAIALHNLPEELAMAVPAATLRSRGFLFKAALLSALAEPAGAIVGLLAVEVRPALNASFMALAAGAMVFVSVHELTPMARRYGHLGWFAIGIVLSLVVHQGLASAIGR